MAVTLKIGIEASAESAVKAIGKIGDVSLHTKEKINTLSKEFIKLDRANAIFGEENTAARLKVQEDFRTNLERTIETMKLMKGDRVLEGVSLGDGPIDAAFLAIEQITGQHYELDDFQIQAVTEGREAMGQTVVKLRSGGKVYSGKGISTDIVGASIQAYINALNKIVYEEETV